MILLFCVSAEQKKEVDYFAWLNNDTPLEKRNNSLALAFNTATGLLGYIDVNPDYYPTGLGLVCKGKIKEISLRRFNSDVNEKYYCKTAPITHPYGTRTRSFYLCNFYSAYSR